METRGRMLVGLATARGLIVGRQQIINIYILIDQKVIGNFFTPFRVSMEMCGPKLGLILRET